MTLAVKYRATEHHLIDGDTWACQHISTTTDAIEHCDEYMEAVTGVPQPVSYEIVEACDDCPAIYSGEEWHNE